MIDFDEMVRAVQKLAEAGDLAAGDLLQRRHKALTDQHAAAEAASAARQKLMELDDRIVSMSGLYDEE